MVEKIHLFSKICQFRIVNFGSGAYNGPCIYLRRHPIRTAINHFYLVIHGIFIKIHEKPDFTHLRKKE